MGELRGTDKFGNRYYESNFYFFARNRWVEYGDQFGWDYNASQIPPECNHRNNNSQKYIFWGAVGSLMPNSKGQQYIHISEGVHRWMHHMTDETPIEKPPTPRKWVVDHLQNKTGTNDIYVPYSTTKPRIESWKPPS